MKAKVISEAKLRMQVTLNVNLKFKVKYYGENEAYKMKVILNMKK